MRQKLLLFTLLLAFLMILQLNASDRKKHNFNSDWLLQIGDITGAEKSNLKTTGIYVYATNIDIKNLGYIHLKTKPVCTNRITLRLKGSTTEQDAFE
jgi:hypothetical protein